MLFRKKDTIHVLCDGLWVKTKTFGNPILVNTKFMKTLVFFTIT